MLEGLRRYIEDATQKNKRKQENNYANKKGEGTKIEYDTKKNL